MPTGGENSIINSRTCALVSASGPTALPGTVRSAAGLFKIAISLSWNIISSSLAGDGTAASAWLPVSASFFMSPLSAVSCWLMLPRRKLGEPWTALGGGYPDMERGSCVRDVAFCVSCRIRRHARYTGDWRLERHLGIGGEVSQASLDIGNFVSNLSSKAGRGHPDFASADGTRNTRVRVPDTTTPLNVGQER